MKNINKFVKNTYGQGSDDEGREKEELKMLTYEVDIDYVMKCVQESLKTDEAKFADNIERAEKVSCFKKHVLNIISWKNLSLYLKIVSRIIKENMSIMLQA